MAKLVMPKNSALPHEIKAVLKIYYEADGWLSNEKYKELLKEEIGDNQYSSSYTKKAQMTSYFGFTVWEDINNPRSKRKITKSGIRMYKALREKNQDGIQEILMESLEKVTFGRNNFGVPQTDSDVEPPNLFIRSVLDLGYLTYKEFAFLIWELEDSGNNYTDAIRLLKEKRISGNLELQTEAEKYIDCKPIMMLARWGFLSDINENSKFGKKITLDKKVHTRYGLRLKNLKIYNIDKDVDYVANEFRVANENREKGGKNILLYGVPGSGKSHTIESEYSTDEIKRERVVFHPDYMNTDFIGQILPTIKEDKTITYEFVPGPFTRILDKAYKDPQNKYYFIIEEINRGNAPAIFGEIFQLLDRNEDGSSCYSINNHNIAKTVYGSPEKPIFLPSNLTILATMNTADQNVFTLDTAFQRRWNMRMIKNKVSLAEHANMNIFDTGVTWSSFNTIINECILENNLSTMSSEDKRLGAYFITKDELELGDEHSFSEKVLKYLWDDAFKFARNKVFHSSYSSLEEVINDFVTLRGFDRFNILNYDVRERLEMSRDRRNEDEDVIKSFELVKEMSEN